MAAATGPQHSDRRHRSLLAGARRFTALSQSRGRPRRGAALRLGAAPGKGPRPSAAPFPPPPPPGRGAGLGSCRSLPPLGPWRSAGPGSGSLGRSGRRVRWPGCRGALPRGSGGGGWGRASPQVTPRSPAVLCPLPGSLGPVAAGGREGAVVAGPAGGGRGWRALRVERRLWGGAGGRQHWLGAVGPRGPLGLAAVFSPGLRVTGLCLRCLRQQSRWGRAGWGGG